MSCKSICKLCDKLIISTGVSVAGTGEVLINLPAGSYNDGSKYCIVIAQTIPTTATIDAPVLITIGSGSNTYELTTCNCRPVTASMIHARTKYSTVLITSTSGAIFRLLGCIGCNSDNLRAINGTE